MKPARGTWIGVNAEGDIVSACNVLDDTHLTEEYARDFVSHSGLRVLRLGVGNVRLGAPLAEYESLVEPRRA